MRSQVLERVAQKARDHQDLAIEQRWDLAVVALNPLDRQGSEALTELKRMYPDQMIRVLTGEMAAAVRQVLVSGGNGRVGPDPKRGGARPSHETLSEREGQVLRLLGLGMTGKQTAAALALSEKTVSTYRSRILLKLELKTTAELVRYAVMNRLAE